MDLEKKIVNLDINDILPNRFQPRIKFNEDSINELSDSIREHGVIQPIVVRKMGDKFEIIAGERRFKASLLAGKNYIPAVVTELNDKDSAEVALIENVQRKDLTPIEEAISYKKILDMGFLTQEELATKLGKTQSTVANKLRLLNLDDEIQESLLEEKISERHARSLLRLTNPIIQRKMLTKIINERLTVRKADDEIAKILKGEDIFGNNNVDKIIKPENNINSEEKNVFENTTYTTNDNQNNAISEFNVPSSNVNEDEKKSFFDNNYNYPKNVIKNYNNNFDFNSFNENNEEENAVPIFEGNEETIFPNLLEEKTENKLNVEKNIDIFNPYNNTIEEVVKEESYNNKNEEPVIIIEEEPTMNNEPINNFQNNNFMTPDYFQNNQQTSAPKEFNPFDMANNTISNDFSIPVTPIVENNQNDFTNTNNTLPNTNNLGIEEPNVNIQSNNNNFINPGFMDIDKIQNEAVDINESKEFNQPEYLSEQTNEAIDIFSNNGPLLKPSNTTLKSYEEENEELQPGKFFSLPIQEETNKNEEFKLDSNPFEFNMSDNLINAMNINQENQPVLKSLDEVSQFKEEPKEENKFNQFFQPVMMENIDKNNNPVNQFGLPTQEQFEVKTQQMPYTQNNYSEPIIQNQFTNQNVNQVNNQQVQQNKTPENNMSSYMTQNIVSNQLQSNNNMNLAMDAIKECVSKIKRLGYNINTEDFDFENMYQIMFRIEK
ncbi:MAG: ParB/RepB/Spo0J family partition protein [Bacilli bacterium]